MRRLLLPLILALAWPALAQPPDPLAPARSGLLLCFEPDQEERTCRAIRSYVFGRKGAIEVRSETQLTQDGLIVMRHRGEVAIKGGAICGTVRAEDMMRADFLLGGRKASQAETADMRQHFGLQYADMVGKEICTRLEGPGPVLTARVTLDGVSQPDATDTALWVRPRERYHLP